MPVRMASPDSSWNVRPTLTPHFGPTRMSCPPVSPMLVTFPLLLFFEWNDLAQEPGPIMYVSQSS